VTRRRGDNSLRDCWRRASSVHRAAATSPSGKAGSLQHLRRATRPAFRDYAVDLLTAQNYPKDGARPTTTFPGSCRPTITWRDPDADPQVRAANLTHSSAAPHRRSVCRQRPVYLLRDSGQEGLLEARYSWPIQGLDRRAAFRLNDGSTRRDPGSWRRRRTDRGGARRGGEAGIGLRAPPRFPDVPSHAAPVPRSDCVRGRHRTIAGRATRSISDTYLISMSGMRTSAPAGCGQVRRPAVRPRRSELAEQIQESQGVGPMPFKKSSATPSLGTPAQSDDITGGIGGADCRAAAIVDAGVC